AERLSQLPYDARMMAMRLIDSGLEMDESRFQACITFAAASGYEDLRSLVIPSLTGGANAVEQSSLRRCNLLVQLGGMHPVPFAPSLLANTAATCTATADLDALKTAITTFVTALGGSGSVELTAEPGE
ncbi:MAG: hypothetical protein JWO82_1389, partial [Akkermansiaceae bacterium]|nr:hypothetical protein [Akkermansiaceae bacterium]